MIFEVNNLGSINKAKIDLSKDLIIFCGKNNTGKTYLIYCIYALSKLLRNLYFGEFPGKFIKKSLINKIERFIKENKNLEIDILELFEKNSKEIINLILDLYHLRLSDTFLVNQPIKNASFNFNFTIEEITKCFYELEIPKSITTHNTFNFIFEKKPNSTKLLFELEMNNKDKKLTESYKEDLIIQHFFKAIFILLFNNAIIFTAERLAINIFSSDILISRNAKINELSNNFLSKNFDSTSFIKSNIKKYPTPLVDQINFAENLKSLINNKSEYSDLGIEIENLLLNGKVNINTIGGIEFLPDNEKDQPIDLNLTGSIVKSLAGIIFYLKHLAQKNDLIIIDEPELNLHPDNQILFARIIAKAINKGLKVILSTHSDYFIRELNNLIMLSKNSSKAKKLAKKYHYENSELIKHSRVGAYLFDGKNRVKNIEISNTGFEVETIDEVINNLNNSSQEIYMTLYD